MKHHMMTVLALTLCSLGAGAQGPAARRELPDLHVIRTATLAPSYSCRDAAGSSRGYERTALFLSRNAEQLNAPDLVFNGACGSPDTFDVSTAGDDMALIADLGAGTSIEEVTAHRAFNLKRVAGAENYSRFTQTAHVIAGHTYAVLLNKANVRGLFVFAVTSHDPNRSVAIRYAVKSYNVVRTEQRAEGFGWDTPSRAAEK
jgi:hypothetical protein